MFNGTRNRRPANTADRPDDNKVRRYVHSPFQFEHSDTTVASCDKDGKLTITVQEKGSETYDQVIVSASLIFRLASMLQDTRKVKWIERSEVSKDRGESDETISDVKE